MDSIHQVEISAAPSAVYDAITTQEGLQGWWSQFTLAQPETDFVNAVSFYGGAVVFKLRNAHLKPGKLVGWHVDDGPAPWVDTIITWSISGGDDVTTLDFSHRGLELPDGPFGSINYAWGSYLTSLKNYLETGTGRPHSAADMAG